MNINVITEEVIKVNNYNLHLIPSKKFKTIDLVAKFKAPLNKNTITKRALLPYLIQQGPKDYSSRTLFQSKLDELYGAALSIDGSKKGNYHIMSFRFQIANQKYIKDESSIIDEAINLFNQILFEPNIKDGAFDPTIFEREKKMLKHRIRSLEDDKLSYANMRLIDEMCKDELYSLHVQGYEKELEKLTSSDLYNYYKQMREQDELDIYLVGDFDKEELTHLITSRIKRDNVKNVTSNESNNDSSISSINTQEIVEKQSIQQAKLHIGYRTNIRYKDDDYYALQVFNGILGAFPSSKLFINVREKNSLAYYANSRIESHKGLLLIISGVAPEDYKQARKIIELQIEAIKNGEFTESELEETKQQMANQLLETLDSPQGIIEMLYQQVVGQKQIPPRKLIEGIKNISKDEVVAVANKLKEDTVYLLTSEGENSVE